MTWGEISKEERWKRLKEKAVDRSKIRRILYNSSSPETKKLLDELKKRKKLK